MSPFTSPPSGPGRSAPRIEPGPLAMVEVAGPEHRVRLANDAFCRLVGEGRDTLLGRPFVEIVANGENCVPLLDRVYETGRFEVHPLTGTRGTSDLFWMFAMWPALDAEARPAGVVIQMTRVDDMRRDLAAMNEALLIGALRQHELREASDEANAALEAAVSERTTQLRESVSQLDAFSYSLAHDLRAPVRAIRGFVQLALELPDAENWEGAGLLHQVLAAAARMEELIQDVLSLNRVASKPMTLASINVEALVRTLLEERPELRPDRVELQVDGPLFPMHGHEATLRQCIANILDNAAKFVAPGERPRIRVWTERRTADPIAAKGKSAAGATEAAQRGVVRLWVEDEGIGIAAEYREKIFEIFERLPSAARHAGTGIGLAIVHTAIKRMGGAVGVEPGRQKGSRFWLQLPEG